jgi:RNAse (barnase) inhibitor barstar
MAIAMEAIWLPIDCSLARDKSSLMSTFQRDAQFPAYFGANWDALIDHLSDLSWLGVKAGKTVVLYLADFENLINRDGAVFDEMIYCVHVATRRLWKRGITLLTCLVDGGFLDRRSLLPLIQLQV